MGADSAIVLMAKQPRAGKTKTRLCPPLSLDEAALFYEAMLMDTLDLTARVEGAQLAIAASPPGSLPYFRQISTPGTLLLPIEGDTIGACLEQSIQALFDRGYRRVIALNTDGPSLPVEYLYEALACLDEVDIVLGPGEDGGYYLIGMNRSHPAIFDGIPWSTGEVCSSTLAKAVHLNLRACVTLPWYDVDMPPDISRLSEEVESLPTDRLAHTRAFFQRNPHLCART